MTPGEDRVVLIQKERGQNTFCWNKGGLRRKQGQKNLVKTQICLQRLKHIDIFKTDDRTMLSLVCMGHCPAIPQQTLAVQGRQSGVGVGSKGHVKVLVTVRFIIDSHNLPPSPAKPTHPLLTAYHLSPCLTAHLGGSELSCTPIHPALQGSPTAPPEAQVTQKNTRRVILSLGSLSGNTLKNQRLKKITFQ